MKRIINLGLLVFFSFCVSKNYSQDKETIKKGLVGSWILNDDSTIRIVYDALNNSYLYHDNVLIDSFTYLVTETCDTETLKNGQFFIKSTNIADNEISCEVVEALSTENSVTTLSLNSDRGQLQLLTKQPFTNTLQVGNIRKSNCKPGELGVEVPYNIPANTFGSSVSVADANKKAMDYAQKLADEHINGYCIFLSKAHTKEFTKNNCSIGMFGTKHSYTIQAGETDSEISQEDADIRALYYLDMLGQANANKIGTCFYRNVEKTGNFFSKSCPVGGQPVTCVYTVKSGTYTSTVSQAAADQLAQNDVNTKGQSYANANGICNFRSKAISKFYTKNNCTPPKTGTSVFFNVPAGYVIAKGSQAEADNLADKAGQDNANRFGTCR